MKFFGVFVGLLATVALVACGSGGSPTASQPSTAAAKEKPKPKKPPGTDPDEPIADPFPRPKAKDIPVPSGPPPSHVVVKDLKKGRGPVARLRSRLALHYVGLDYKSHKPFEIRWGKQPFVLEFGPGLELQGWEEGLPGMRVGGRRKLIVPSNLAYGQGAVVYVLDLLAVERRPQIVGIPRSRLAK
jgi:peptidylprolyl isomerase